MLRAIASLLAALVLVGTQSVLAQDEAIPDQPSAIPADAPAGGRTPPTAPTGFSVQVINAVGHFGWIDTSDNEQGFSITATSYDRLMFTANTDGTTRDPGAPDYVTYRRNLRPFTAYCFSLVAYNITGKSEPVTACATTGSSLQR